MFVFHSTLFYSINTKVFVMKPVNKKSKTIFDFKIPTLNTTLFKIPEIFPPISKKKKPITQIINSPEIFPKKKLITLINPPTIDLSIKRKKSKIKPKIRRASIIPFKGKEYDIQSPNNIKKIATILNAAGSRTYIVGGYVRDILLDKKPKDVDLEVHGLTIEEISYILRSHGYKLDEVGKSFGVLKVKCPDTGEIIDVAVPRTDSTGRKPEVSFLKSATPYDAAKRRDLTINSIMLDVSNNQIVDPFNGIVDLERGNIKHVSNESFSDDPLRTVRAAQFAARFGFTIDPETKRLARSVDSSKMAPERVTEEMRKVFEKSHKPSIFFQELDEMGQLEKLFPEVKQLQNVKQDPIHHPEGSAYVHTMQVMDRVASSDKRKLEMLVSALFHDIGKINTTMEDPETKRIHARGHEIESEKLAAKILAKYKFTSNEIKDILSVIKHHMKPHSLVNENASKLRHKNKLIREICTPKHMMKDPSGSIKRYCDVIDFAKHDHDRDAEKYEELKNLPPVEHYVPEVTGQDLIDMGFSGKELGEKMEDLYLNQISQVKKKPIL